MKRDLLGAALVALLVVAFYHPLLDWRAMQSGGDAANLFWPIRLLIAQSLWHDGIVPLWNPYSFMGAPLMASLQHAVFYPPDWLLYSIFPAHVGMNLSNIFHLALAGAGTFLWARRGLDLSRMAAASTAMAFPCCAWFWGQQEHINQIAALAWLPFQALATWSLLRGRITPRVFALAYSAISAVQLLAGHPQEGFYAHLFCGMLVLGSRAAISSRERAPWRTVITGFLGAGLLSGLIVALQLLPTMELQRHSRRQFADPTYAVSFSMPPDVLMTYLSPHKFGNFRDGYYLKDGHGETLLEANGEPAWDLRAYNEYAVYVGLPILLLAVLGIVSPWGRRVPVQSEASDGRDGHDGLNGQRRAGIAVLLGSIIIVSLLLAMGGNTDPRRLAALNFTEFPEPGWSLHEILVKLIPPAKGFRVPARAVTLASFGLVSLAAIGAHSLLQQSKSSSSRKSVFAMLSIAVFVALYVPSLKEKFHYPVAVDPMLSLVKQQKRHVASLDNRVFRLTISDDTLYKMERHLDGTRSTGNSLFERQLRLQPHQNIAEQVPLVDGYEEGLIPTARYRDFMLEYNRNLRSATPDPKLLNLLGVGSIYSDLPINGYPVDSDLAIDGRPMYRNTFGAGTAAFSVSDHGYLKELDGPWWRHLGPPREALNNAPVAIPEMSPLHSLHTKLVTANSVDVEQGQATPKAILAMGWFPGWTFDSGKPVEWLSAVHAQLPGSEAHGGHWDIHYRPVAYRVGLFLTALGIALWAALFASARRTNY